MAGILGLNSLNNRTKAMRANSGVTLCLSDPDAPYRYWEVRGKVVAITGEAADDPGRSGRGRRNRPWLPFQWKATGHGHWFLVGVCPRGK